jgi:hypothetical protein
VHDEAAVPHDDDGDDEATANALTARVYDWDGGSWCPPNAWRIADSRRFWKSAPPRDAKRA